MKQVKIYFSSPVLLLAGVFLSSLMFFALVEMFREQLYFVVAVSLYLIFHNAVEFFSIIALFGIFIVSWFTYKQSRDDTVLFLGCMFLGVGLLDFIHTLSFSGEPAFFTANSTNKAILFWLAARLLFAAAFFISAFVPQITSRLGHWRHLLLGAVLLYSTTVFYAVIFYESSLPAMFILGSGLTPLKIYLEYTVVGLLVLAYAAYVRIYFKRKEVAILWYLIAITISIFSELAFTLFESTYDTFNMLGHIYKFLAFCAIYAGVFIVAIRRPYVRVAETAAELQKDIILRKNAERYTEKIISSANAMIIGLDLEGKVTLFNEAAEKISGYRKDEVIGRNWFELIVPRDRFPKVWEMFETSQKQGESIAGDFENPILTKSGEERIIEWRNSDLLDGSKVIGTISYGIDITKRKQAEEKLKELDKLKDDFLMVTTHELKSPLIPIKSQSQLLLAGDYGNLNQEQKEAVEMIQRNEEVINALANEVLDISKIKSDKLKLVLENANIRDLVTEVVGDMKALAEQKQISFSLLPIPEMPKIMIDGTRVRQVLRNVLDNAIKFTPEQGSISVGVEKTDSEIVVRVKDSGIGLAKEDLSKLFTPFFRAESDVTRKYRGTGLGLAISKGLIEAHGGIIQAESEGEGKGSTFIFTLPLVTQNT